MDPKVQAVLDEYEARAAVESAQMANPNRRRDELLLPVGPATASLMSTLVKEAQARRILEVGSSYGYSTVWLAEAAAATGGKVTSLEVHAGKVEYAKQRLAKAGLAQHVDFKIGDALETLRALPGPFDFVLLDLWKNLYVPCFELIHPKLAAGGLILADNMLYPDTAIPDANAYRERVRAAPRMTSVLLSVGSGIEISRYR
jgi:predicted O-methyltransferase YrrM